MYVNIYIYIHIYIYICVCTREFKDPVFEDVVFDNNRFLLYPILRCYLLWGHRAIVIKHHIPELPQGHFNRIEPKIPLRGLRLPSPNAIKFYQI